MLPDHSQINIPLQAWETLRACLTPRQHALERSLTPVNLSDLRDLQLCPATGPPRPLIVLHCRPLQSQPLQLPVPVPATSRSPASTAATAVLLVLLMAIVMNEDLWSSLFIGTQMDRLLPLLCYRDGPEAGARDWRNKVGGMMPRWGEKRGEGDYKAERGGRGERKG